MHDKDRPRTAIHMGGKPSGSNRDPLPAGDPLTWGLITRGTVLEGMPYPVPNSTVQHLELLPPVRAS